MNHHLNLLINLIILRQRIKRGKSREGNEFFDGEEIDQSKNVSGKDGEEDLLKQNSS